MKEEHVKLVVCPQCKGTLELLDAKKTDAGSVESGKLQCCDCKLVYPVIRHIPRFIPLENYADNFGLQWTIHARTQYDSYSGANVSRRRFFEETKWPANMAGQIILEVGSGSGRFTEQAASTGAMVVSMDYSYAVEANYASNGKKDNVFIVQADVYKMPFRENFFDKLFCLGVLQHTPDVKGAFTALPAYLKAGGDIAVDVYRRYNPIKHLFFTKYWVRPITKRMDPAVLYKITNRYIRLMWPLARLINKLPYGRRINKSLLVCDYRGVHKLSEKSLKEWAVLDTFDMLSPAYDSPQTIETVRQWFEQSPLSSVDICCGYNGIEGRAKKKG